MEGKWFSFDLHAAFEICSALSGGLCTYLFGGFDAAMKLLCALAVFDYLSGFTAAVYQKKLNSRVGFRGILKKCCMFAVVAMANIISVYTASPVREIAIFFYISNEGLSFLENMGKMIELPKQLSDVLAALSDREGREIDRGN